MRLRFSLVAVLAGLSGIGCGSDDSGSKDEFDPPPARAGYTRLVAPLIEEIEPGADLQFCQIISTTAAGPSRPSS